MEATAEIRYSVRNPSRSGSQRAAEARAPATIVEAVSADPRFETLAQAVTAAGLAETLKQEGPFTVFAPTNEAFARLPEGTLSRLLESENKEELASILTSHVVAGNLLAKEIESGRIETLNGRKATVKVTAAGAKIDGAEIVETDIQLGNGVVHVIDEVICPPSKD